MVVVIGVHTVVFNLVRVSLVVCKNFLSGTRASFGFQWITIKFNTRIKLYFLDIY